MNEGNIPSVDVDSGTVAIRYIISAIEKCDGTNTHWEWRLEGADSGDCCRSLSEAHADARSTIEYWLRDLATA